MPASPAPIRFDSRRRPTLASSRPTSSNGCASCSTTSSGGSCTSRDSRSTRRSTWNPQNYDSKFEGKIPLRRALYESRNLATIRLGMELGETSVIDEAHRFGITSAIPPYPSIHIGAASVYPIEMIAAYSTFATLGTRSTPTAITRVENQKGDVLWEPAPTRVAVMSPEEAWLMVDMMKDVVRRGTAAGSVGSLLHVPAGGKTGTTNDGTDVWYIGYTSDLVAGVWMGLDKPQKIKANAQGGVLAAPAWAAFMNQVYRRKPPPPDWPRRSEERRVGKECRGRRGRKQ